MAADRTIVFGLGAQKAGTSWLHRMLQRHRDVHLPLVKELHYWTAIRPPHFNFPATIARKEAEFAASAWLPARIRRYQTREALSGAYVRDYVGRWNATLSSGGDDGHRAYLDLMGMGARGRKVVGDITPAYALLEADTLKEMAELGPDVRFVFLMRDPVARLWSGVKHRIRVSGVAPQDRQKKADAALREALEDDPHMARRRSDYAALMSKLDQVARPDQVLYLFYETLFSQESFDAVTRFLDVAPLKAIPDRKVNARSPENVTPDPELLQAARVALDDTYRIAADRFGDQLPARWRTQ